MKRIFKWIIKIIFSLLMISFIGYNFSYAQNSDSLTSKESIAKNNKKDESKIPKFLSEALKVLSWFWIIPAIVA
jgi:uncharacterized protein YxeA